MYVPSEITSLNHKNILITTLNNAKGKKFPAWLNPCIVHTPVVVKVNNDTYDIGNYLRIRQQTTNIVISRILTKLVIDN